MDFSYRFDFNNRPDKSEGLFSQIRIRSKAGWFVGVGAGWLGRTNKTKS
jgi:hypothetical protein